VAYQDYPDYENRSLSIRERLKAWLHF
jgi:hypothetical protein